MEAFKMDLRDKLQKQKRMTDGVWTELAEGGYVKLGSIRSPDFTNRMSKEEKDFRRKHRIKARKPLEDDQRLEVLLRAMYPNVVQDWKDLIGPDGESFEYNRANYEWIMGISDSDGGVWDFRDVIVDLVTEDETFDQELEAEVEGN
jgi:hypothetical protein